MGALFVFQTIMAIVFAILVLFLIRQKRLAKYEKRFSSYTLSSVLHEKESIMDSFFDDVLKLIKKISHFLRKNILFAKLGLLYDDLLIFKASFTADDFNALRLILILYLNILWGVVCLFSDFHFVWFSVLIIIAIVLVLSRLIVLFLNYKAMKMFDSSWDLFLININKKVRVCYPGIFNYFANLFFWDLQNGLSISLAMKHFYQNTGYKKALDVYNVLAVCESRGLSYDDSLKKIILDDEDNKCFCDSLKIWDVMGYFLKGLFIILVLFMVVNNFTSDMVGYLKVLFGTFISLIILWL